MHPTTSTARPAHLVAHTAATGPAIARRAASEHAFGTRRACAAAVSLEPRGAAAQPLAMPEAIEHLPRACGSMLGRLVGAEGGKCATARRRGRESDEG